MKYFVILCMALLATLSISCKETKKDNQQDFDSELDEGLSVRSRDLPVAVSGNMVDYLLKNIEYSTLAKGLKSTGLVDDLDQLDSLTLFAPTNEAFEKLPEGMVTDLMEPQGKSEMIDILKFHIVEGIHNAASLKSKIETNDGVLILKTLQGTNVYVSLEDSAIMLTHDQERKAAVIDSDNSVSNGIVHGIDTVIIPD